MLCPYGQKKIVDPVEMEMEMLITRMVTDFYIQMNMLKGFFDILQEFLIKSCQKLHMLLQNKCF